MELKQLLAKRELITGFLKTIDHHLVQTPGLDRRLRNRVSVLSEQVRTAFEPLIDAANAPKPERSIKEILNQIAQSERLTPELIKEAREAIRRS